VCSDGSQPYPFRPFALLSCGCAAWAWRRPPSSPARRSTWSAQSSPRPPRSHACSRAQTRPQKPPPPRRSQLLHCSLRTNPRRPRHALQLLAGLCQPQLTRFAVACAAQTLWHLPSPATLLSSCSTPPPPTHPAPSPTFSDPSCCRQPRRKRLMRPQPPTSLASRPQRLQARATQSVRTLRGARGWFRWWRSGGLRGSRLRWHASSRRAARRPRRRPPRRPWATRGSTLC